MCFTHCHFKTLVSIAILIKLNTVYSFYEEINKCASESKMHQLHFSKKSVMNNGCWLKALVSDFARYIGG